MSVDYDGFRGIPTGNICDSNGLTGALTGLAPVCPDVPLVGRALTVRCDPLDNLPIHKAVSVARAGDVIVVECDGFTGAGAFGEMLAMSCVARGVRGFVTDGAIRDSAELRELGFPVYSRGVCPNGTEKIRNDGVGVDIVISGVTVRTGDAVIGDADGVCVVAAENAAAVLEKAHAKMLREDAMRPRLEAGETVAEIIGLADRL